MANLYGHIAKPGFSTLPVYHEFGHFGMYVYVLNAALSPSSHLSLKVQ